MIDFVNLFVTNSRSRIGLGKDEVRVGAIKFSTSANLEFPLNKYNASEEVYDAFNRIEYVGGWTNTSGALRIMTDDMFTIKNGDRPDAINLAIIVTDGKSTKDEALTIPEAKRAHNRKIIVYAVGITDEVNDTELAAISTNTTYWKTPDFSGLASIITNVLRESCRPDLEPKPGCRKGGDLVFILDSSGSIGEANYMKTVEFVQNLIGDLPVNSKAVRIAVTRFSEDSEVVMGLNEEKTESDMIKALGELKYKDGSTNTARALEVVRIDVLTNGNRPDAHDVVVLLTDGESNSPRETLVQAELLKTSGAHVITAGIGDWTNPLELFTVASYPNNANALHVDSYNALVGIRNSVREYSCDSINECELNPCEGRGQCVDLIGGYLCICNIGFSGPRCQYECKETADVVFLVDSSGSIGRDRFKLMIEYVQNAVLHLAIESGTRVAVIVFSDTAEIVFHLNKYSTRLDLLNGINIPYIGGKTNTAEALRMAREQVFTAANGDRDNIRNVVVLVTDGVPTDRTAAWNEAMNLRDGGAVIITVAECNGMKCDEMWDIATFSHNSGNMITVEKLEDLGNTAATLGTAICNNIDDCACLNNAECTDNINSYSCRCPSGFSGTRCGRRCTSLMDLTFVADTSGSIRNERFPLIKQFLRDIVETLPVSPSETHVAAVTFSADVTYSFSLNKYKDVQSVMSAISRLGFDGGKTNIASALRLVRTDIMSQSREGAKQVIVILTDGASNIESARTIPEAVEARMNGIHIMAVPVGNLNSMHEIMGIASHPWRQNVFPATSINMLKGIVQTISDAMCDDTDECSSNPCQSGGTCVNDLHRYICECPPGRVGYNCETECSRSLDLTLVIDLSASRDLKYEMSINFTRRLMYGLDFNFDRTQVALVTYSDTAVTLFRLNTFRFVARSQVESAVTFGYRTSSERRTNTQAAINLMRREVFVSNFGDRPGVKNTAVIITDGFSNIEPQNTVPEADRAKDEDGIELYAVSMLDEHNLGELNGIASDPDGDHVMIVRTVADLDNSADQLAGRLCQ